MHDDFLNHHKMLNSVWIPIKLTKRSNKCLIFRKNFFFQKKIFGSHVQLNMTNTLVTNTFLLGFFVLIFPY